jgi:hypothetical protein
VPGGSATSGSFQKQTCPSEDRSSPARCPNLWCRGISPECGDGKPYLYTRDRNKSDCGTGQNLEWVWRLWRDLKTPKIRVGNVLRGTALGAAWGTLSDMFSGPSCGGA